ncbi:uncharacterized protein OCT59_024474 [Rhizophagus irregularis]|uniref:Uncharacterized protein n=1 Tax=Rhizophagus irregularis TaxID=588596 RepID=A0A915YVZ0_9GLOM|nr:hypothetical protein OCT59_024474 [Rhizophagus irregularis]CAB5347439.1 unnamed protein product [Rhizophagus irregularis]
MSRYLMSGSSPKKSIPTRRRIIIEANIAHMDSHDIAFSRSCLLSRSLLVVLSNFSPKFLSMLSRMTSALGSSLGPSLGSSLDSLARAFFLGKKMSLPYAIIPAPELREAKED